jgi:hypothetical protein
MKNWYAVYKGDTFLCQGTKEECARYLNVKPDTIYFMTTPTYKKRRENGDNHLIVIKVEEINDDEYILVDNQNRSMI